MTSCALIAEAGSVTALGGYYKSVSRSSCTRFGEASSTLGPAATLSAGTRRLADGASDLALSTP